MPRLFTSFAALALASLVTASCQSTAPAGGAGPGPVAEGRTCGGIAALQCGAGQYCRMEPGQCRSVADAAGVCTPRPEVCTMIYAPVCGCDGKTYASACKAASEGASVAHQGECRS